METDSWFTKDKYHDVQLIFLGHSSSPDEKGKSQGQGKFTHSDTVA